MPFKIELDARWVELGLDEDSLSDLVGCSPAGVTNASRQGSVDHLSVRALRRLEAVLGVDLYKPHDESESNDVDAQIGALLANHPGGIELDAIASALHVSADRASAGILRIRRRLAGVGMTVVERERKLKLSASAEATQSRAAMELFALSDLSDDEIEIVLDIWVAVELQTSRRLNAFSKTDHGLIGALVARGVLTVGGDAIQLSEIVAQSLAPLGRIQLPYRGFRVRNAA